MRRGVQEAETIGAGQEEVDGGGNQLPADLSHANHVPQLTIQVNGETPQPSEESTTQLSKLGFCSGAPGLLHLTPIQQAVSGKSNISGVPGKAFRVDVTNQPKPILTWWLFLFLFNFSEDIAS